MGDKPMGAAPLPPEIAELLEVVDSKRPAPVRRSTKRDPKTRQRSLELEGAVPVGGGVYLPIAGFDRPRRSSKPALLLVAGAASVVVANGLIVALGVSSILNHGIATALIFPPFVGWSYQARATAAAPTKGGAFTPGILALPDALVLRYPDGAQVIDRSRIAEVSLRKTEETSRDQQHMLVTHELVIGTADATGMPAQIIAWRLIEHSGALSIDADSGVATMPAIAEHLQTRWLGKPSPAQG